LTVFAFPQDHIRVIEALTRDLSGGRVVIVVRGNPIAQTKSAARLDKFFDFACSFLEAYVDTY
jgi:hypothetical protein